MGALVPVPLGWGVSYP